MNKRDDPKKDNAECEKVIDGTFQGILVLSDGNEPYAVPVNHGFSQGSFFFHCGKAGKKLDFIRKNAKASYVISKYFGDPEERVKSMKCHGCWESLMVFGTARIIEDKDEFRAAFKKFMAYHGQPNFEPSENAFGRTNIIELKAERMTLRRELADKSKEFFCWER